MKEGDVYNQDSRDRCVCVCVFAREMCTGKDIKDDYKK
jgi:hypothetical protein